MIDSEIQKKTVFKKIFLKGVRQCIATGDSICSRFANESNFLNQIYRKEANQYLYDKSMSGSNIAYISINEPEIWNPFSFIGRSESEAVNSFDITNADLLIVWGGFNDKGDNVLLGDINSTDPFTIAGAIRLGVQNYLIKSPDLKICFITPNSNPYQTSNNGVGLNLIDYKNQMKAVCLDIGIPCFDLYDVDGITEANKATALPDQIHPSAEFLEQWAVLFAEFIENNINFND